MADDESPQEQTRAVTVRVERVPVADIVPIFDTSRFDHYGRIAAVMANAKLVPDALRGSASDCFLVVNQADRWGMDPFAVAQCCSVVHGRLMYEGKLVAAVIRQKTGIEFDYYFTGARGKDERRVYVSDRPFDDDVIAKLEPGGRYRGWRIIDGSIGEWKTKNKDGGVNQSWVNPQQADMQLCYRGGRVWARLYESAIMLGVYTDDELEEIAHRQDVAEERRQRGGKAPLRERLAAPQAEPKPGAEEGFSNGHVETETKAAGEKASEKEPAPEVETIVEGAAPAGEPYFLAGDEIDPSGQRPAYQDGEPQGPLGAGALPIYSEHAPRPTKGDAQTAEDDKPTSDSATPASTDSPEATSGPHQQGDLLSAGAEDEQRGAESSSPTTSDASPAASPELDDITAFITVTAPNAKTFAEGKGALSQLMKTSTWADAEPHEQRGARVALWTSPSRTKDKIDPGQDPTAFRCWLEVADDEDAVNGTLGVLERSAAWDRLRGDQQATLKDAARMAKTRIRDARP